MLSPTLNNNPETSQEYVGRYYRWQDTIDVVAFVELVFNEQLTLKFVIWLFILHINYPFACLLFIQFKFFIKSNLTINYELY